jgi:hypothetical protein
MRSRIYILGITNLLDDDELATIEDKSRVLDGKQ